MRLQVEIAVDAEKLAAAYVQAEMDLYARGGYTGGVTGGGQKAATQRPAAVTQALPP